jgi:hypothetical protein
VQGEKVFPTTRFPSLDGRELRGGWSDKIWNSHQSYHPHPDLPPSRERAISGIAGVIGQPAKTHTIEKMLYV